MLNQDILDSKLEWDKIRHNHRYLVLDNFVGFNLAVDIRKEILDSRMLEPNKWDRYDNPFEQKNTFRDKFTLPPNTAKLLEYLNGDEFLDKLGCLTGYKILEDKTRNWWGIHTFNNGDYLDIHLDAGLHPQTKLKKYLTLGIYFSTDWTYKNGGSLELWSGDSAIKPDAKLFECIAKIEPIFNRMILFECNDYAWHGAPEACICQNGEQRIFITCSYLIESINFIDPLANTRMKALFIAKPDEEFNNAKQQLRIMRSNGSLKFT